MFTDIAGRGYSGTNFIKITFLLLTLNAGFADGVGTAASFYQVHSLAIDQFRNLYAADTNNHRIRKITQSGIVTSLAGGTTTGFTDGLGPDAKFFYPQGIAVDPNSGAIFVSDSENHAIRLIVPCDGGYYVQNATCQVCPAETFSLYARFDISSCIPCGAGSSSAAGSSTCLPILATTFVAMDTSETRVLTSVTSFLNPLSAQNPDIASTLTKADSSFSEWATSSNQVASVTLRIDSTSSLPRTLATESAAVEIPSALSSSNNVIYISAAFGSAGLLGVTGFFVYQRMRSNGQAKTFTGVAPSPHRNSEITQLSGSPYLAQQYSTNMPSMNSGYRPISGLQTNGIFGNQIGQSFATEGWSDGPSLNRNSVSGSYAPSTQFGPLPNMINPTMYNRPQSGQGAPTLSPTSLFQYAGNMQTFQTGGFDRMTTTGNTQFARNTITVMPKATLQFPTVKALED